MAKPKVAPTAPEPSEELPILESIGWTKLSRGWVVILTKSQGDKIIEKEILSEPESRAVAVEKMQIAFVRRLIAKARA